MKETGGAQNRPIAFTTGTDVNGLPSSVGLTLLAYYLLLPLFRPDSGCWRQGKVGRELKTFGRKMALRGLK